MKSFEVTLTYVPKYWEVNVIEAENEIILEVEGTRVAFMSLKTGRVNRRPGISENTNIRIMTLGRVLFLEPGKPIKTHTLPPVFDIHIGFSHPASDGTDEDAIFRVRKVG